MRCVLSVAMLLGVGFVGLVPAEEQEGKPRLLQIRLTADEDGGLDELMLDGETIERPRDGKRTRFDVLHDQIRRLVEDPRGRRKDQRFEAELDCDFALQYKYVIQVITAISGYNPKPGDDKIVRLIDKIKFRPPPDARK